jgi:hypothetical protein
MNNADDEGARTGSVRVAIGPAGLPEFTTIVNVYKDALKRRSADPQGSIRRSSRSPDPASDRFRSTSRRPARLFEATRTSP